MKYQELFTPVKVAEHYDSKTRFAMRLWGRSAWWMPYGGWNSAN